MTDERRKYFEIDRILPRIGRIRRALGSRDPRLFRRANTIIDVHVENENFDYLKLVQSGQVSVPEMIANSRGKTLRQRARAVSWTVYLVRGVTTGLYKIGISADAKDRLSKLQCGSPDELVLVATIPGGRAVEQQIHTRFASRRVRGEWFRLNDEDVAQFRGPTTVYKSGEGTSGSGRLRAIQSLPPEGQ